MIENKDTAFSVDGRSFYGFRELGFTASGAFVIDAWTTPRPHPRGSYFTTIPISGVEHRKTYRTLAAFCRESKSTLAVYNDWGQPTRIKATREIIDALEAECAAVLPLKGQE